MEISPLSDRSVAEEEEQAFPAPSSRRKKRSLADRRAALRPWAIGIGLTVLVAVASVAAYRLAAGIDWWNEHPSAAATPTVRPTPVPSESVSLPCRAATRSDPTACWCAQPSTQHPPTPNQNYPKKPKKTPRGAQNSQPSTTTR